jgi:hypothetical protein
MTFLDEGLHNIIEKKLMFINDPASTFPVDPYKTQTFEDIVSLHRKIAVTRFGNVVPWNAPQKSIAAGNSISETEWFIDFQLEVNS